METTDIAAQIGEIKSTILAKIAAGDKTMGDMQRQLDALDKSLVTRVGGGPGRKQLTEHLQEIDGLAPLMKSKRGSAYFALTPETAPSFFERKTLITSAAVGASTSGVLEIDRITGVTPEARQQLFLRDLLTARPTTLQLIDYVRVATPLVIASPQTEGSLKAQNAVTFESKSETVRTVATWIPASRQILDDFAELGQFLDTGLRYYCDLEEELQMLFGAGTGVDMNGLNTQATAFSTGLLSASAGWNKIDIVGRACEQLATAKEFAPTFIVCSPIDWWGMRLTKDSLGHYILGDPATVVNPTLFGLNVLATVNMPSGSFLIGTNNVAAVEIRDRMQLEVEISTENEDYFLKNLVAIRAERRSCIIVKRPGAFLRGTFTSSPS